MVTWYSGYRRGLDWRLDFLNFLIQRVTTFYSSLLLTSVHSHVFTLCCLVAASNGGRSSSSGFPNYPLASASGFSQQHLTMTQPQQFCNGLTRQPTQLTDWTLTNNISTRTAQTTPVLCCCLRGRYLIYVSVNWAASKVVPPHMAVCFACDAGQGYDKATNCVHAFAYTEETHITQTDENSKFLLKEYFCFCLHCDKVYIYCCYSLFICCIDWLYLKRK
jgi:hypothetical protein